MANSCGDCAYTTCARLHSYVDECRLSDRNPCLECVQMAKLDSQISKVQSQLAQLAQKRHASKTKINRRHEPFIHRLPLELSSQIFVRYVHQVYNTFDPKEAFRSRHAKDWSPALFLSSICSTWRKIAFATPEIWRFIFIPLLGYDPDVDLKRELLNDCVGRTGQYTLFIGVFQFQPEANPLFSRLEEKLDEFVPLFEAINAVAHRSEELTIWGLPMLAMRNIIPDDTPSLRAVQIVEPFKYFEDGDWPMGWNSGSISLAGPLLRSLEFGANTSSLLGFSDIEWNTFTTVTMSGINLKEGFNILRQAPCLTSCSFLFESGPNTKPVNPPIIHSALEKLDMDSDPFQDYLKTFANSVTLPSLRELSIQTWTLPNMKPLFDRSQCQIRTLTLILEQNTPEDSVLKLLNILPSVEHFTLEIANAVRMPVITNNFFERLRDPRFASSGASAKPFLPNLSSLSYTGIMAFTWPAFLEVFPPHNDIAHAAGRRPLSEVSLELKLPKGVIGDHGVVARLRQIQQSKIELVVTDLEGEDLL